MSEVLICENCKSYWMQTGEVNYCGNCGSSCLISTHEGNLKQARNYKGEAKVSRRDEFAMAALKGILSHGASNYINGEWVGDYHSNVAKASVDFADALLAELDK